MQPTFISLTNFKSIRSLKLDLTEFKDKVVLISGENRDEDGASSNRSGKSNLMKAFIWVLFGVKFIDSTNDEITTYGETETVGLIRFGNVEVERRLKKGGQTFFYRIDGKDVSDSNKDAQELFLKDFDLEEANKIIISNSIYLNSEIDNLIQSTPSERLKVLTTWLNLERYDQAVELTRDKIKEWEFTSNTITQFLNNFKEIDISTLEQKKQATIEASENYKLALKGYQEKQKEYDNYATTLRFKKGIEQQLADANKANERILKATELLKGEDIILLKDARNKIIEDNQLILTRTQEINTELRHLAAQVEQPYTCPECNSSLVLRGEKLELSSKEIQDKIKETSDKLYSELKALPQRQPSNKYDERIEKYQQIKVVADQSLVDTTELQAKLDELFKTTLFKPEDNSLKINELTIKISSFDREIGHIEAEIANYQRLKDETIEKQKELDILKENLRLGELWAGKRKVGLFQEIKSLQLSLIISNLELLTNNYLNNHFEIQSRIKIEPTAKGVNIFQDNNGLHPIESMSSGEKARVAFSIALALKEIYTSRLEILMVDEFFSSLDNVGMEYTINVLSKIKGMKFLISHSQVECDNEIKLIKEKGVTRL